MHQVNSFDQLFVSTLQVINSQKRHYLKQTDLKILRCVNQVSHEAFTNPFPLFIGDYQEILYPLKADLVSDDLLNLRGVNRFLKQFVNSKALKSILADKLKKYQYFEHILPKAIPVDFSSLKILQNLRFNYSRKVTGQFRHSPDFLKADRAVKRTTNKIVLEFFNDRNQRTNRYPFDRTEHGLLQNDDFKRYKPLGLKDHSAYFARGEHSLFKLSFDIENHRHRFSLIDLPQNLPTCYSIEKIKNVAGETILFFRPPLNPKQIITYNLSTRQEQSIEVAHNIVKTCYSDEHLAIVQEHQPGQAKILHEFRLLKDLNHVITRNIDHKYKLLKIKKLAVYLLEEKVKEGATYYSKDIHSGRLDPKTGEIHLKTRQPFRSDRLVLSNPQYKIKGNLGLLITQELNRVDFHVTSHLTGPQYFSERFIVKDAQQNLQIALNAKKIIFMIDGYKDGSCILSKSPQRFISVCCSTIYKYDIAQFQKGVPLPIANVKAVQNFLKSGNALSHPSQ